MSQGTSSYPLPSMMIGTFLSTLCLPFTIQNPVLTITNRKGVIIIIIIIIIHI